MNILSAEIEAHEINDEIDMIEYQRVNVQTSPFMGYEKHADFMEDQQEAFQACADELIEEFEVLRPKQTFFS